MKSYFDNYTKHFFKVALSCEPLESQISTNVLGGGIPHHALHLSLSTVHIHKTYAQASDICRLINENASNIAKNAQLPLELTTEKTRYTLMGETHIKFFALEFDSMSFALFIWQMHAVLCGFLTRALELESRVSLHGDRRYIELWSNNALETEPRIRIPVADTDTQRKSHISLFSSNDLKRDNKTLYKNYTGDGFDPVAFMTEPLGNATNQSFTIGTLQCS